MDYEPQGEQRTRAHNTVAHSRSVGAPGAAGDPHRQVLAPPVYLQAAAPTSVAYQHQPHLSHLGSLLDVSGGGGEDGEEEEVERETWSRGIDFLLSCIGFAVGLGNIWRFPYLCYRNGGGAFLIPYMICLLLGGVPAFFLEISLGQFMRQGGLGAWKISPAFQGIGVATTIISFLLNVYYIVILSWDGIYLINSFQDPLPWATCNNTWNTDRCFSPFGDNSTDEAVNTTGTVDPAEEYWNLELLKISPGIDEVGEVVWQLAVSLLIIWIIVYFCVWKGVKWTGKVVYFTATFPYVVLTILLVRGLLLDGAGDGLTFYLKPDFSRLSDLKVWVDGGTQIFFSYAIALGAMTALGSYNKIHQNCYKDCIIIATINSLTSLYGGLVVFSVLGFMAHEQGVTVKDVVESGGPGLVFIAYPKAISQMPVPQLWAVLFFVMIILIGLDSQFVGVEGVVTVACDLFPRLRHGSRREIFIAGYCTVSFLLGLTMVTNGGVYVFELFNTYAASGMSLLWVCFFECVVIFWVYGGDKFYDNIELMIGFRINPLFKYCWAIITPFITAAIFLFMWVDFSPLQYNSYEYPLWAEAIGFVMAFTSMLSIPIFFIIKMFVTPGTMHQKWVTLTTPVYPASTAALLEEKSTNDYRGNYNHGYTETNGKAMHTANTAL